MFRWNWCWSLGPGEEASRSWDYVTKEEVPAAGSVFLRAHNVVGAKCVELLLTRSTWHCWKQRLLQGEGMLLGQH